MALRNLHADVKAALVNNTPVQVYHLIKFEKPSETAPAEPRGYDFVYLTDAPYPVEFDDGSGPGVQTYQPTGVLKIGKIPETTVAKASGSTLELDTTKLGGSAIASITNFSPSNNGSLAQSGTPSKIGASVTLNLDIDLFEAGFFPGDEIKLFAENDQADGRGQNAHTVAKATFSGQFGTPGSAAAGNSLDSGTIAVTVQEFPSSSGIIGGNGYDRPPRITIRRHPNNNAPSTAVSGQAEATVVNGVLTKVEVSGGTHYLNYPTLLIEEPPLREMATIRVDRIYETTSGSPPVTTKHIKGIITDSKDYFDSERNLTASPPSGISHAAGSFKISVGTAANAVFDDGDIITIGTDDQEYVVKRRGNDFLEIAQKDDENYGLNHTISGTESIFIKGLPQITDASQTPDARTVHVEYGNAETTALTSSVSALSFNSYVNKTVDIYRCLVDPSSGTMLGKSDAQTGPFLLFKGIVSKGSIKNKTAGASSIVWTLTSHWGDFIRVQGRLCTDEFHRALDVNGVPAQDSLLRPEYGDDLGFEHGGKSLNIIAPYNDTETEYKFKKSGGVIKGGIFGGGKEVKETKIVKREIDIRLDLSAKFIPIVYGVQRVEPVPVFADFTVSTIQQEGEDAAGKSLGRTVLYTANMLCEGPIQGIYDIIVEGDNLVCRDYVDVEARGNSGDSISCEGNMIEGSVLQGQKVEESRANFALEIDAGNMEGISAEDIAFAYNNIGSVVQLNINPTSTGVVDLFIGNPSSGFTQEATGKLIGETGIPHRRKFNYNFGGDSAINIVPHNGLANQEVDEKLSNIAKKVGTQEGFRVQANYGDNFSQAYWGPKHRLLDTVYVVQEDSISSSSGKQEQLEYILKGKYINCYNYDGSYRNFSTNSAETGTATPNRDTDYQAFGLGRIVTLEIISPTDLAGTTSAQIIDTWNHTGSTASPTTDPLKDYRFRFGTAPTRANGATGNEGFTRQLVNSGGVLSDPNANPTVLNNIITNKATQYTMKLGVDNGSAYNANTNPEGLQSTPMFTMQSQYHNSAAPGTNPTSTTGPFELPSDAFPVDFSVAAIGMKLQYVSFSNGSLVDPDDPEKLLTTIVQSGDFPDDFLKTVLNSGESSNLNTIELLRAQRSESYMYEIDVSSMTVGGQTMTNTQKDLIKILGDLAENGANPYLTLKFAIDGRVIDYKIRADIFSKAFVGNSLKKVKKITVPGIGYHSEPEVTITGGGGTGATAEALINNAGRVSNLLITNRGKNYTSTPTITIAAPEPFPIDTNRINLGINAIQYSTHRFQTGDAVKYSKGTGNTAIGGLVDGQVYYVIRRENTGQLQLATTRENAQLNQALNLTSIGTRADGSPRHTLLGVIADGTANPQNVADNSAQASIAASDIVRDTAGLGKIRINSASNVSELDIVLEAMENVGGFNYQTNSGFGFRIADGLFFVRESGEDFPNDTTNTSGGTDDTRTKFETKSFSGMSGILSSKQIINKNSSDPSVMSTLNGMSITFKAGDELDFDTNVYIPSANVLTTTGSNPSTVTDTLAKFIDDQNIIPLREEVPSGHRTSASKYTYNIKTSSVVPDAPFFDGRVSNNPVIQMMDYLTNERYGKGLSLDLLDLPSFQEAAQACDERAEVTVSILEYSDSQNTGSTSIKHDNATHIALMEEGDYVQWPLDTTNNGFGFQGTIAKIERGITQAKGIDGITTPVSQITFKDCVGKIANKWIEDRVYLEGAVVYTGEGFGVRIANTGQLLSTAISQPQNQVHLILTGLCVATAGETLTQANSGATGVVHSATGNGGSRSMFLKNTTGTFNRTDKITGSTSGNIGVDAGNNSSVPTEISTYVPVEAIHPNLATLRNVTKNRDLQIDTRNEMRIISNPTGDFFDRLPSFAPNGNPFVKRLKRNSGGRFEFTSGYSLYDSDDVRYWKYVGWDQHTQRYVTRHQLNTFLDTSEKLFDNVNSMLEQFNGILRYSNGKYFMDIKTKAKNLSLFDDKTEIIKDEDIIGDIKLDDKGISQTFNAINAGISDPSLLFENRDLSFFNSTYLKQDKGIQRQGTYSAPFISNYFNARMNIKQALDESRSGLTCSFTMAPKGYLLHAGNIVAITNKKFNFDKKLFRLKSIQVADNLLVDIVAEEHNDDAFILNNLENDKVVPYLGSDTQLAPKISPVRKLTASVISPGQNVTGGIQLTWRNHIDAKGTTHQVEIWRNNVATFTGEQVFDEDQDRIVGGAQLIATVPIGTQTKINNAGTKQIIGEGTYVDPITSTETIVGRYYWVRYKAVPGLKSPTKKSLDPLFSQYTPRSNQDGVLGQGAAPSRDSVCGISKGARSSVDAIITNVAATPGSSTEFYDKGSFSVPNSSAGDNDPTSIPAGTNLVYRRASFGLSSNSVSFYYFIWNGSFVGKTFGGRPDSSGNFPTTANVDIIHNGERYQVGSKQNSDSNWATNNTTGTDFFAIKTGEVEGQEGFEAWTFRSFPVTINTVGNPGTKHTITSSNGVISLGHIADNDTRDLYAIFDAEPTPRVILGHCDSVSHNSRKIFEYWRDITSSSTTLSNAWTRIASSVPANGFKRLDGNKVTAPVNGDFASSVSVGDRIILTDTLIGSSTTNLGVTNLKQTGIVTRVISNTSIELDNSIPLSESSFDYMYKASFKADPVKDAVVAKLTRSS